MFLCHFFSGALSMFAAIGVLEHPGDAHSLGSGTGGRRRRAETINAALR